MIQLTREADYGVRVMAEVATRTEGVTKAADMSRRQQVPYEFLRKVCQTLVSHGLLVSERGARGGFSLARSAETITLLDVLRAFGSPSLNRCTADPPKCDRIDDCVVYPVWAEAQDALERVLNGVRLSELDERQAAPARTGRRHR